VSYHSTSFLKKNLTARSFQDWRRPLSGLHTSNSCWPTRVGKLKIGVRERHNSMLANCWRKVGENTNKFYLSPAVCRQVVVSFTLTNLSLPTPVGQHWLDVWRPLYTSKCYLTRVDYQLHYKFLIGQLTNAVSSDKPYLFKLQQQCL